MTEERKTDATGEGAAASTGNDPVETQPKTVEEVEAFWRNRFSARDRAHNAETAALKAQLEAKAAAPVTPQEGESPEAARVRALEQELATERSARKAEALRAQYPLAAGILGESIGNVPETTLAAIEAGVDNGAGAGGPPIIDPNAAPRARSGVQAPAMKPVEEKSKDELLADLRRIAPAYQQALQEGTIE